jgi:hypothetical protein
MVLRAVRPELASSRYSAASDPWGDCIIKHEFRPPDMATPEMSGADAGGLGARIGEGRPRGAPGPAP